MDDNITMMQSQKKARVIMRCTTKATIKDTGDCICTFLATSFRRD